MVNYTADFFLMLNQPTLPKWTPLKLDVLVSLSSSLHCWIWFAEILWRIFAISVREG